jgi:transcriptional regulator with XRE-family HTH domain
MNDKMRLMTSRKNFSEWVLKERHERDWSQAELARHAGKSRVIIHKIENGTTTASPDTIVAIARAFKVPLTLAFRKAGLLPSESPDEAELTDWKEILAQLSERDRNILKKTATIMLELDEKQKKRSA